MISRILPILLLVAAIAMFFLYIWPQYKGPISDAQKQIASYNSTLQAAQVFQEHESKLMAERNAIPADSLTRLQEFLPDDVDNIQLILDLSSLASRTNMQLSSFAIQQESAANGTTGRSTIGNASTSPATPSPGLGTAAAISSNGNTDYLELSVTATGTYQNFRTFLAAAEQSLRILDVTNLTITSATNGNYSYNITFRLYWLH